MLSIWFLLFVNRPCRPQRSYIIPAIYTHWITLNGIDRIIYIIMNFERRRKKNNNNNSQLNWLWEANIVKMPSAIDQNWVFFLHIFFFFILCMYSSKICLASKVLTPSNRIWQVHIIHFEFFFPIFNKKKKFERILHENAGPYYYALHKPSHHS